MPLQASFARFLSDIWGVAPTRDLTSKAGREDPRSPAEEGQGSGSCGERGDLGRLVVGGDGEGAWSERAGPAKSP